MSTVRPQVTLGVFGRTHVGLVRDHNEDNFIVADLTTGARDSALGPRQVVGAAGTLLGVCDGMGGAAAGEVASLRGVDVVFEEMRPVGSAPGPEEIAERLVRAIETAGRQIWTEAQADRTRRGMGTTATMAAIADGRVFLGQVGDSRAYLLRGDRLVRLTRDQSLVTQLIEAGQLTEEEADSFEYKNVILQALGSVATVDVDLTYAELRGGDTLLLCSDGLSGMLPDAEIRKVLLLVDDPREACDVLLEMANQAGGNDNVTVIVARVEGDLELPTPEEVEGLKYRKFELLAIPPDDTTMPGDSVPTGERATAAPPDSDGAPAEGSGARGDEDEEEDEEETAVDREAPVAPASRSDVQARPSAEGSSDVPLSAVPRWLVAFLLTGAVAVATVAYRRLWG